VGGLYTCLVCEQGVEAAFPVVVGGDGGVVNAAVEAGGIGQLESVRFQFLVHLVFCLHGWVRGWVGGWIA